MADLVTHLCTVLLPAGILGYRRVGPAAVGVALPDVLARVVPLGLVELVKAGVPLPEAAVAGWGVLHEPIPLALAGFVLVGGVVARERREAGIGLAIGAALHLAVDLLQDHHGRGYFLLAPLSIGRYELGLIGSEATVGVAPWLALATALVWAARRLRPVADQAVAR